MAHTDDKLKRIFNDEDVDDILGPTQVKKSARRSSANNVVNNFSDVIAFFEAHLRLPDPNSNDNNEVATWVKLDAIGQRQDFRSQISEMDKLGILNAYDKAIDALNEPAKPMTAEDILQDDEFDDLFGPDNTAADILGGRRAVKAHERENVDQTNREPCPSFENYRERFERYKEALETGKLAISTNRNEALSPGDLFLWDGLIALLSGESIDSDVKEHSGKRLHVVFSNGTEAWLREGSIKRSMYVYGNRGNKVVCKRLVPVVEDLFSGDNSDSVDDNTQTGFIYVVRTLSKDPGLSKIRKTAVKIGVTKNPVAVRVANAEKDPTFLCAPVDIVSTFTLHNLSPRKVEETLHAFFGDVRLKIKAKDRFNNDVMANEWFLVPVPCVDMAVDLLVSGTLSDYRFNKELGQIEKKADL